MRKFIEFAILYFGLSLGVCFSQIYPAEVYRTASGRARTPAEIEGMKRVYDAQRQQDEFDRVSNRSNPRNNNQSTRVVRSPAMRVGSKKDLKILREFIAPDKADLEKYQSFLREPKTGIFKLFSNDCADKSSSRLVLDVGCLQANLDGAGSYYSFRRERHSIADWSDLGYSDEMFFTIGLLNQSVMVNLGQASIETLNENSSGVKFLAEFVPAASVSEAEKQYKLLAQGFTRGNFRYASRMKFAPQQTFALRSVAYRGELFRDVKVGKEMRTVDLLDGDKRKDVLILFHVVRRENDGTLVILWKELQRKESLLLDVARTKK